MIRRKVMKMQKDPSLRGTEWADFSTLVSAHIENYTIKQYGDMPNDNLQTWSVEDCLRAIDKYVKRNLAVNARGYKEALRDMVKIAHYACVAMWKMRDTIKDDRAATDYFIDIANGR